jgi:hypothetical protein
VAGKKSRSPKVLDSKDITKEFGRGQAGSGLCFVRISFDFFICVIEYGKIEQVKARR